MTDRTYDFTRTTRLVKLLAPVAFVAWLSVGLWTTTEQPRWLVVGGLVLIGIGALVYGLRLWRQVIRRATLHDDRLHVVTTAGVEHDIPRSDIEVRLIHGQHSYHAGFVILRHSGGNLYLLTPQNGSELAELLSQPVSG